MTSDSDFYQQDEEKFRNWASGEPNNNYGRENCAEMCGDRRWNDGFCYRTRRSICSDVKDPFLKQVKLKVMRSSSVDLNDPDLLEDLLTKMKQKLREQEVSGDRLSWRKQKDGKIFQRHEEKIRRKNNDEL